MTWYPTHRRVFLAAMVLASLLCGSPGLADDPIDSLPSDAPLSDSQEAALEMAMVAASKIPLVPDSMKKDRSRAQHRVFMACLELDQPRRAAVYLDGIANWRRGAAAADLALYLARRGYDEQVIEHYVRLGRATAKLVDSGWKIEYIELRVAQAYLLLGKPEVAEQFSREIVQDLNRGKIDAFRVETEDDLSYEQVSARLDALLESGRFEPIVTGGKAYTALYRRYYSDEARRDEIEGKLREAYKDMQGTVKIDLFVEMGDAALAHGDRAKALSFADEAGALVATPIWRSGVETEYLYAAKVIDLRYRAGAEAQARAEADAMVEKFDEEFEEKLWSHRRADALRPLAELYHTMGLGDLALETYGRALEHGMTNKNSRCRANDLVDTCASMALYGFEPDDRVWARIQEIMSEGLGSPW